MVIYGKKYTIIIKIIEMKDELIAGITAPGVGGSSLAGSITIATIPIATTATVPAAGLAGLLGLTTTATTIVSAPVTLPVAGIVAVGALLTYGGYKAYNFVSKHP
ncbi:hypothetical protein QUA74_22925 [Microcoleus sp. LAD1_D3]|uniref:hypothetical protein n=1 Tax=Microcoleus sp. LAD1_D3 TaxID=2819365 RepID=UPI002FD09EE0